MMLALVLFDLKGLPTHVAPDQTSHEVLFYLTLSGDACIHSFTCIINIYGFKLHF